MLGTILIVLLILALLGALPRWPHSRNWGYAPTGGLGLILLIVPGLYLLTIWSMLIPVIVLEGRSAGEAFTRSREVVRGSGWSVFGLIIITFLLVAIASAIIRLVFTPLPRFLDIWLGSLVAHSLTVPFAAAALTTAYFKLVAQTEPASPAPLPTP